MDQNPTVSDNDSVPLATDSLNSPSSRLKSIIPKSILQWSLVVLFIYGLLVAVSMISTGFKGAFIDSSVALFDMARHPLVALVIGILATALLQSSSAVTSILVGLVAGGMPISIAIPMVMGANVGTTVTNTIVSLGLIRHKDSFKKAFAAGTVHDFFNLMAVLVFLPLEITFQFLEKASLWLTALIVGTNDFSISGFSFVKALSKPVVVWVKEGLSIFSPAIVSALLVVMGVLFLFITITSLSKMLKRLTIGRVKERLHSAIGKGRIQGVASGALATVVVQSSSTTTSLMVPLVGAGVFSIRQVFPFMLGANIGTCITAILAATAVTTGLQGVALQLALAHLLFNLLGVLFILSMPVIREWPIKMAESLATYVDRHVMYAFIYVLLVFFLIPIGLIGVSSF